MARKVPGLARVLGAGSLASVAYGEVGSSLYFALGIVALQALGLTAWVLLAVGALFVVVSLSYAEGAAAIPEAGGAATFVRRAFNDLAGFVTGWLLFLDYLIVIALAALFVPHYVSAAVGWDALADGPWDGVAAVGAIVVLAAVRLFRRAAVYRLAQAVAAVAFLSHVLLVVVGLALLGSSKGFGAGVHLGSAPTWHGLFFALPLAMLAYTGLETVANLAAEAREPGKTLPRSLFAGIGAVVVVSFLVAAVGLSAFPPHRVGGGFLTDLGTAWVRAPLVGIASAFRGSLPGWAVDALRVFLGVTGALILVAAVSTSISGAARLAYSMARHGMLPRAFGTLGRRTLVPPAAIVSAAVIASGLLVVANVVGEELRFLASLYSFGVLVAFTAAQVAVVRLRFREPALERPFRVRGNVRVHGVEAPLVALVGAPLTFAVWIAALTTHEAARIAGPVWLLLGLVVFAGVRRARGEGILERVHPAEPDLVPAPEGAYERILVPLKLGPIGDEILATAIKLAEERSCKLEVLHVVRVPFELPLDAALPDEEERARASLEEARVLAAEHGVGIQERIVRARSLGEAIVAEAERAGADLVVLGSAPRWRRQSRFFSPTVDYVLRRAPCEVMVVAYPQGVLEETGEPLQ